MKKKLSICVLIAVIFVIIYNVYSYLKVSMSYNSANNTTQISVTESKKNSTAFAYYLVFESLMKEDSGLSEDIKYIAVDLTGTNIKDKDVFIKMVQMYCENNQVTLLEDTLDGLKQKGYIKDLTFNEGVLISFHKIEQGPKEISLEGEKWRSGKGAIGVQYNMVKGNEGWKITNKHMNWIS